MRIAALAALAFIFQSAIVQSLFARPVSYRFTGTIGWIQAGPEVGLASQFAAMLPFGIGDEVVGLFTYDTDVPDSRPQDDNYGVFVHGTDSSRALAWTIAGHDFRDDADEPFAAEMYLSPFGGPQTLEIWTESPLLPSGWSATVQPPDRVKLSVEFYYGDGTAPTDAILPDHLRFSDFNQANFIFSMSGPPNPVPVSLNINGNQLTAHYLQFFGRIDTLRPASFRWVGGDGAFHVGENWDSGAAPQGNDEAIFSNTLGMQNVSFDENATVAELQFADSDVTFDMQQHTFAVTRGITIGTIASDASLTVTGGTLSGADLSVAEAASDAQLTVTGTNAKLSVQNSIIGWSGTGALDVSDGGTAQSLSAILAHDAGSHGQATVTGQNSLWEVTAGPLIIGKAGEATLEIAQQASVMSDTATLGERAASRGAVTVTGQNAMWEVTGALTVGENGTGELHISDQARVISLSAILAHDTGSHGQATITGRNSLWEVTAGPLIIGKAGEATLDITQQASVMSGTATLGEGAASRGTVTVTGQNARWEVTEAMTVGENGTAELHISGQGQVISRTGVVGARTGANGTVMISGPDSGWSISGGLSLGQVTGSGGDAHLTISDGASLSVDGDIRVGGKALLQLNTSGSISRPATVEADRVDILADGRISGSGIISSASLLTSTTVSNGGLLEVQGNYVDAENGRQARLYVDGDYMQSVDAKLVLHVDDDNRTTGPTGTPRIPLVISGDGSFDGTLKVDYSGPTSASQLRAGDRFHLAELDDIESRFKSFEGSLVPGRDDIFFGLHYVSPELLLQPDRLELVALETPLKDGNIHLSTSSRSRLILIAPGTADDSRSFSNLRQALTNKAADWDVVVMNWQSLNGTDVRDAVDAAEAGIDVGESIHHWLVEKGLQYTDGIHLFGHSSGVWLADSLADMFAQNSPNTPIHLTLFDAFTPSPNLDIGRTGNKNINRPGAPDPVLGESATFADHIVDTSILVPFTKDILPNFLNVDVTEIRPSSINSSQHPTPNCSASLFCEPHFWPVFWYEDTVLNPQATPDDQGRILGFANSLEWRETRSLGLPPHGNFFERGSHLAVRERMEGGKTFREIFNVELQNQLPIVWTDHTTIPSETGSVVIDQNNSVVLRTGSPVMLTSFLELPETVNMLSVDFEFLSAADGLLSVFFDGDLVFDFDSQLFEDDYPRQASAAILLEGEASSGTHTMIVRVDPLQEEEANVRIFDLMFSLVDLIPVPVSWVPGDFNGDGVLDVMDADSLGSASARGDHNAAFDLNGDARVDQHDVTFWVREFANSWIGDANLDGEFNSGDMVQVFVAGEYETGEEASWSEGDWNGDGFFDSSDMVTAFADGGYEKGPRTDAVAVPEPTAVLLLIPGLGAVAIFRRHLWPWTPTTS